MIGPLARYVGLLLTLAVSAIAVIGCRGSNSTITPTARATLTVAPSPTPSLIPTSTSIAVSPSGGIGPDAIWTAPNTDVLLEVKACPPEGRVQCAIDIMDRLGASTAAILFFRKTGAFLSEFHETGLVDMAIVSDPWRANDNSWPVLVNGTPDVVVPEAPLSFDAPAPAVAPEYQPFMKFLSMPIVWQAPEAVFEGVAPIAGGGQLFTFRFPIKDGCHACNTGYWAQAAFDFGPDGMYLGARLLPPCWAPAGSPSAAATPVPIAVDACPAPSVP
jgi:hypothetical protein